MIQAIKSYRDLPLEIMNEVEEGDVGGSTSHTLGCVINRILTLIIVLQLLLMQVVESALEDPDNGNSILW